ncbi:hypothetical protein [Armatimonas sp.]|uniref:hypothetical protein n=1 Tax=Armatimonas sp. TaxID=1872638 RepID=UPI00286C386C|nr:hypothetical protein [Armatimonas sp.]
MEPPWIKLLITDASGRYLLAKWRDQWEVPGTELSESGRANDEACLRFLEAFARELGVQIRDIRLAAEVRQHFARREAPTPFRWYAAHLDEEAEALSDELAWMPLYEALLAIPYPAGRRILQQITQWPSALIRGEYEVDYSVNPPGGSLRILRDFSKE